MSITGLSLREIKKARTKKTIYEAFLELMGEKMFHEVMLEDICRQAEVSRVTFFKFFPKKEDLLVYFMRIWLTERIIELETEQQQGFAAVRHLLRKVAEQSERMPGILPSLISLLAELKMHPRLQEMSEAEVRLFFPDHVELASRVPDLHDLFRRAMEEAARQGTLREDITIEQAVKILFTIFYGSYLTAQQFSSPDILGFYELHLQLLEQWGLSSQN